MITKTALKLGSSKQGLEYINLCINVTIKLTTFLITYKAVRAKLGKNLVAIRDLLYIITINIKVYNIDFFIFIIKLTLVDFFPRSHER